MTSATITLLAAGDLAALGEHVARHGRESGRDGDVIFRPRSAEEALDPQQLADRYLAAWGRPLDEPLWLRSWGVWVDGVLRGHLDLNGGRLPSELHRAALGMGIERPARRRGHGRAMIRAAIAWAQHRGLAWIDLGVFAHNHAARALYRSLGFVETGTTRDQFRVDGQAIDDVAMTLAL